MVGTPPDAFASGAFAHPTISAFQYVQYLIEFGSARSV
jgi:hypothetical protein